jgi:hypothetical protein
MVTIQTKASAMGMRREYLRGAYGAGIASALILPFGSIVVFRRRRAVGGAGYSLRLLSVLLGILVVSGFVVGCSSGSSSSSSNRTPTGQSSVVIMATSGSVSQQATIALSVQ